MMSKNMSRRGFVKASAAAGAATMLAACGGNGGSDAGDGAGKKVLYFGQSNPKEGIDMQKSTNSGESAIADSIVESPLRWTEDNVLVTTFLTEIPTFSDDGLTLPCEIKEGVTFHDGTPLTSEDVKYSIERMFKPATAAKSTYMYDVLAGAKEMLAGEAENLDEGITIEDERHFTFHLASPMVTFVNNLGISYAHIFPKDACEAAGEDWGMGLNMIGTGKYKLAENDDTTEVVLVKNEAYYDGEPALDEVHYVFYDDNATKVNALKAGEIDWCDLDAALPAPIRPAAALAAASLAFRPDDPRAWKLRRPAAPAAIAAFVARRALPPAHTTEERRVRQHCCPPGRPPARYLVTCIYSFLPGLPSS